MGEKYYSDLALKKSLKFFRFKTFFNPKTPSSEGDSDDSGVGGRVCCRQTYILLTALRQSLLFKIQS